MGAKSKKSAKKKSRSGPALSPAEKAAYGDIKLGIKHVETAIGEVQKGLRKAEKAIQADAKQRVRELRKEAKLQLAAVKDKRREAARLMRSLSVAAEGSWQDVKQGADQALADARATASGIAERIRSALQR